MRMTPREFRALFTEFNAPSWHGWNAIEDAIFAQPCDRALVLKHTKRATLPSEPVSEFWAIAGRGAGKSRFCGRLACYVACARRYRRVAGESIYIGVFGPDKAQARVTFRYVVGLLRSVPALAALIVSERADSIELSTGVIVEVIAASVAAPRGRAYALVIVEEAAFLPAEEHSVDADRELLRAVRPALARVPGSLLAVISSPYAMRGELYRVWQTRFGKDDPHVLVVQAETRALNPAFSEREIARAYEDDPTSAAAEYGATFRDDVAEFFGLAKLAACVAHGISERRPDPEKRYVGHFDGATGSGDDDAALSIAAIEEDGTATQVALRRWEPPFSPQSVVREAAGLLHRYRVEVLQGDRYAPGIFADLFRSQSLDYAICERDTSANFIELLALVNSESVQLLDEPVLLAQLRGLERRTRAGGHDRVGHRSRAHDDVAAAAAGALVLAASQASEGPPLMLVGSETYRRWEASHHTPQPEEDASPAAPEGDDDVVDIDEAEFASWPAEVKALCEVVPDDDATVPRGEQKRRWHAALLETVKRVGHWFPEDH